MRLDDVATRKAGKMKKLKIIGAVLGVVFGVLAVGGLTMSNEFSVERSVTVAASPEVAFQHVADLQKQQEWNAWRARDPSMQVSFPGDKTVGVGAFYTWTSENSGEGVYTITATEAPRRLEAEVDFKEMGVGHGWWTFEPTAEGTRATWGFESAIDVPVLGPWMVLAFDMEGTLGKDFDEGLSLYKKVVEGSSG